MPSSCLQCGTRGVCPQCRARASTLRQVDELREVAVRVLGPATRSAVLSDHRGAEPVQPTDPESSAVDALGALEVAVAMTERIAVMERGLEQARARRVDALRQATTGPDAVPVAEVAKRLGMSRQRLHKLLRDSTATA